MKIKRDAPDSSTNGIVIFLSVFSESYKGFKFAKKFLTPQNISQDYRAELQVWIVPDRYGNDDALPMTTSLEDPPTFQPRRESRVETKSDSARAALPLEAPAKTRRASVSRKSGISNFPVDSRLGRRATAATRLAMAW